MTPANERYRSISLWMDRHPGALTPRPELPGDTDVDVAIVGAGFTGLWTAYYLHRADPRLRIMVLEKDIAGFGASGRNGGWCSELFPASWGKISRSHGRSAALALKAAMRSAIDEVESVTRQEGIDCDFTRGGTVGFARSAVQLSRAVAEVEHARRWGDSETDMRLLSAAESAEIAHATGVLGATYTPHCAALDPAALVRGLADRVVQAGVTLHEGTEVIRARPGRIDTTRGTVRAGVVMQATEAYSLPGARRDVAPVYSLIIATEPLPPAVLSEIGLQQRPTFTDHRHLICYGQQTADGRLVFGGRGAPYHFGSAIRPEFDRNVVVFNALRKNLIEMFPALAGVRFTHSWGGPLGIPRDWHAGVVFDRTTGMARAGGYVGDGVSTTNLAGRTLADLITGQRTPLTELPWVGHVSPRWEPEPLRYLGINAALRAMSLADQTEARTGKASKLADRMNRLIGG